MNGVSVPGFTIIVASLLQEKNDSNMEIRKYDNLFMMNFLFWGFRYGDANTAYRL